jgi:hypothetical protein
MSAPEAPKTDVSKSEELFRSILPALSMDSLLRFRDQVKKTHARQLELINEELAKKGYVEPHLEGTRALSPE